MEIEGATVGSKRSSLRSQKDMAQSERSINVREIAPPDTVRKLKLLRFEYRDVDAKSSIE